MDERDKMRIRREVTALDRVMRNEDGLSEKLKKQAAKRRARRRKREQDFTANIGKNHNDTSDIES